MTNVTILTLFPDMFTGPLSTSIIKRAQQKKLITINIINIRDYAQDRYGTVDDHPYGGGAGMLLKVDVLDRALTGIAGKKILLDPQGTPYTQQLARELSKEKHIVLICGHYEGVDERIRTLIDQEISIGDYVLSGGEIPALVLVDSITRLLPGVLVKKEAALIESFTENILEYPQYTRPKTYKGMTVPNVLSSGDHAKIDTWKKSEAKKTTLKKRPDLFKAKKDSPLS